jgi:hypothetical protein
MLERKIGILRQEELLQLRNLHIPLLGTEYAPGSKDFFSTALSIFSDTVLEGECGEESCLVLYCMQLLLPLLQLWLIGAKLV